jgi:hypothetical protein
VATGQDDERDDEDLVDLEAVRADDAELDDIADGGPGGGDWISRLLVAWRDTTRPEEEPMTEPDWLTVELADLHLRELPDGRLFLAITATPLEATPEDLIEGRELLRGNVKGIILDAAQRRELAARIADIRDP